MHIWNINKIVFALKENSFTEKQKNIYKIVFWVLFVLIVPSTPTLYAVYPSYVNNYDLIDWLSMVAIGLIGFAFLVQIYKKSKSKADNRNIDLFLILICLNIPIFLRSLILQYIAMIVGYIVTPFDLDLNNTNIVDLIISIISYIAYTMMMLHYYKKVLN